MEKLVHYLMLIFLAVYSLLSHYCTGLLQEHRPFSSEPPSAIFVFGDSLSDTGNAIEVFPFFSRSENFPFGSTFFHSPTGRFSDGRLIIDFMASKWGFPFVEPYFNNIVPNYRHGINFAVSGATARNITDTVPFFLPLQTDHFIRFKRKVYTTYSTHKSGCVLSHIPPMEAFDDGLYMISIGINDILDSFLENNSTPENVREKIVPPVVAAISKAVQDLHKEGAKNFMVFNILAIGCMPGLLTLGSQGPFNSTDQLGCLQDYNGVADFANNELEKSLHVLNNQFEDMKIMVVDLYKFLTDAIAIPINYGFKESEKFKACCGYGGDPYNYSPLFPCGKNSIAKACSNPSEYISWDGLHPTEAFSQQFVEEMMTGMHYLKPIQA